MRDDYFIGVHARELERLRDQHAAWEPETRAVWAAAGFGAGQHLADLGSGPGFSALDLARLVGPSGRVTALDKASSFLQFLRDEARTRGLANIDTLEADLTKLDVIEGRLDGAFCRFFLAFLIDELDRALACIHRSLKPGGMFAAMEYLTVSSTTCSPPIPGFDAHTQAWIEYYRRNGGDTSVGTYLPAMLVKAGFSIVSIDCAGGIGRPGERWWDWWGRLIEDFGDKLAADGLMTPVELQDLKNGWTAASRQPHAFMHTPLLLQIVARKA